MNARSRCALGNGDVPKPLVIESLDGLLAEMTAQTCAEYEAEAVRLLESTRQTGEPFSTAEMAAWRHRFAQRRDELLRSAA